MLGHFVVDDLEQLESLVNAATIEDALRAASLAVDPEELLARSASRASGIPQPDMTMAIEQNCK